MSTKRLFARLNRPVEHSAFWAPGLTILILSLALLWLGTSLRGSSDFLKFSIFGIATGALLLFRTRLGTTLYFCLIFSSAIERYERGFDVTTLHSVFQLGLSLLMFVCLASIGWEQLAYHFDRHRRSS